jgi:putative oxidoreductase
VLDGEQHLNQHCFFLNMAPACAGSPANRNGLSAHFARHGETLRRAPHVPMFDALQWNSLAGVAGLIEIAGGALLLIGLFTRPVAFILCGFMAVAYFMAHASQGNVLLPMLNQGELAVLYCFVSLYLVLRVRGVERGRHARPRVSRDTAIPLTSTLAAVFTANQSDTLRAAFSIDSTVLVVGGITVICSPFQDTPRGSHEKRLGAGRGFAPAAPSALRGGVDGNDCHQYWLVDVHGGSGLADDRPQHQSVDGVAGAGHVEPADVPAGAAGRRAGRHR